MSRPRSESDAGVSSGVVAFLIAGVLFMASVAAVLVTTRNSSDRESVADAPQSAAFRLQARDLAGILLESPGYASTGYLAAGADWADGAGGTGNAAAADHLTRLGLIDPHAGSGFLDYGKLQNLRHAPLAATTDGFVNYREAAQDLGLAASGLDFHIRSYPALPTHADHQTTQTRDQNLRVTYIGDIDVYPDIEDTDPPANPTQGLVWGCGGVTEPANPPTASTCATPQTTCDKAGATQPPGYPPVPPGSFRIGTWVYNGGTAATQFSGTFDFYHVGNNAGGTQDPANQNANTWLVPAGEWVFLYVDVPTTDNFGGCDDNSRISVNIRDLGTASLTQTADPASLPPTPYAESPKDMWLDTSKPYYKYPPTDTGVCDDPVSLYYSGSNTGGGGNGANGEGNGQPFKDSYMWLKITDQAGANAIPPVSFIHPTTTAGATIPGVISGFSPTPICLPVGGYIATLFFCNDDVPCASDALSANKERVTERILVHDSTLPPYTPVGVPCTECPDAYDQSASSLREVEYLSLLSDNFCPYIFSENDELAMDEGAYTGSTAIPPEEDTWDERCGVYPTDDDSGCAATFTCREESVDPPLSPPQYGDVFPDSTQFLNEDLPKRLAYDPATCDTNPTPRYDITNVLIVGSNVNQNAMTNPVTKQCVANWIAGGGTLVVLGSGEQNASWLNEVIEAAITSSSGAISTPDAGHPLLHAPEELAYPAYDNRDRVWDFEGTTETVASELFSNIILQDVLPITTLSNPGALTEGDLLLTTWTPYDVFDGAGDPTSTYDEGLKLMHNLLMQSYRDLFLDYGPEIPSGTNVVPEVRFAQVDHPGFANPVQLKLLVYVF